MLGDSEVVEFTFTVADVERVVRRLASLHPDRRADCQYTRGGASEPTRPLCLFAHALVELGVPVRWLADTDAVEAGTAIDSVLVELEVIVAPETAAWCVDVQEQQDIGCTWAEAVRIADLFLAVGWGRSST